MIEKFNLDCDCGVEENEDYNKDWAHLVGCSAINKDIKEKVNSIVDYVNYLQGYNKEYDE